MTGTTYKVRRGHVYHVVHETKTDRSPTIPRGAVWTLCGSYYDDGERGSKPPTCPSCLRHDNPLFIPSLARVWLEATVRGEERTMSRMSREQLIKFDYIDHEGSLTRRGKLIARDFLEGAIPMTDDVGIVHARRPLNVYPLCHRDKQLPFVDDMTTERYAKLRLIQDQLMVTCLQCLVREGPHDDVY